MIESCTSKYLYLILFEITKINEIYDFDIIQDFSNIYLKKDDLNGEYTLLKLWKYKMHMFNDLEKVKMEIFYEKNKKQNLFSNCLDCGGVCNKNTSDWNGKWDFFFIVNRSSNNFKSNISSILHEKHDLNTSQTNSCSMLVFCWHTISLLKKFISIYFNKINT